MTSASLEVVILCGGKGTRAYPDTVELPKPLLPVAGLPIVEHVMRTYAAQGHTRFILAAGYLGQLIAERYADAPDGLEIEVVDTGLETETGERLRRAAHHVQGERFFATYADGLADIDLDALLDAHLASGALATLTTVPLPSQYGILESDDDQLIRRFREKPRLRDHWINGGFFVFEKAALAHWTGEVLERDVLPKLADMGELFAYRHQGFWKSMDTYKDRQELEVLATAGSPPWADGPASLPATVGTLATVGSHGNGNGNRNGNGSGHGSRPTGSTSTSTGDAGAAGITHAPAPSEVETSSTAAAVAAPAFDGRRANSTPGSSPFGEEPEVLSRRPPGRDAARRRMAVVAAGTALVDLVAVILAYSFAASIETGPLAEKLVGSDRLELFFTAPIWIVAFASYGLYDRWRLGAGSEEARRLLHATAVAVVAIVLVTFVAEQDVGRSWIAVISVTTLACVGTGRLLIRGVSQLMAARGVIGNRLLVVGANEEAHRIARTLDRQRWLGYHPVGLIATEGPVIHDGFPIVGTVDDLPGAVSAADAASVIVATSSVRSERLPELCATLHGLDVDVRMSAALPDVGASRLSVEPLDGLAVLSVRRNQLARSQVLVKRAMDVAGSAVLMVLTAPLLAVLTLLVRLTSSGPAFFRQVRVGESGKPFVLYKFRTMEVGAEEKVLDLRDRNEADGPLFKLSDDPRVTRLGRFLRRWGLDELPQLWNVLKGEMSLVGPRPPLPTEAARYDKWVQGRLKVKPGITGMWQVKGGHILSFDDYVRYDLFYVENWSVGLDLYVLARTLPALVFRRGMT